MARKPSQGEVYRDDLTPTQQGHFDAAMKAHQSKDRDATRSALAKLETSLEPQLENAGLLDPGYEPSLTISAITHKVYLSQRKKVGPVGPKRANLGRPR